MKCPQCGAENNDNVRFCYSCGKVFDLYIRCPHCNNRIRKGDARCSVCGWEVSEDDIPKILKEKELSKQEKTHMDPTSKDLNIQNNPEKTNNTQTLTSSRTNNTRFIAIAIISILLLGIGVSALFLSNTYENKPTMVDSYDNDMEIIPTNSESKTHSEKKRSDLQHNVTTTVFGGYINEKYAITLTLDISDTSVNGSYYYNKNGSENSLNISGTFDESSSSLSLREYNKHYECTGEFEGTLLDDVFFGTYTLKKDGSEMNFYLTKKDKDESNNQNDEVISKYVYINATELRLRLTPSTSGECLTWSDGSNRHPEKGEMFPYLGESGDFYKINYNGYIVYVSRQFSYIAEPYLLDKIILDEANVDGLSKEELRILRNEVYARHGHIFKSQDLNDYFSRFEWYTPETENAYTLLNEIEKRNIDYLNEKESSAPSRNIDLHNCVICIKQ